MTIRENLKEHKRVVIKVGTTTLTYPNGKINLRKISKLAWTLSDLLHQGKEIILVSSGAVAVGTERLGLAARPRDVCGKQAASAVGQAVLMQIYENFFNEYNQKVAQILLTRDVLEYEQRKNNAANTMNTLLAMGVIPIVNANDTVSTDELDFSDNDTLSAYVADLIEADCLIILSDINGLYNDNPRENPEAEIISVVSEITEEIFAIAGGAGSNLGTGGMATKITAAAIVTEKGIDMVIASGEEPTILFDILSGEETGTLFVAAGLEEIK